MTTSAFPARGVPVDDLLATVPERRRDDADWKAGRTFSLVYNANEPELDRLHDAIATEFLHENYLNPFAFPSLLGMETELVAMAADLLHGPDPAAGKITSGGTESIFLAVQTAREHGREALGIAEPRIVTASTAHPAFAKACHYLDIDQVRVPVRADGRADVDAMAAAVDGRTALLVGSAPCYPFGVIDDIPTLAGAASERGILCHVDACLGGWLLPFWERLGRPVPPWDLSVPGVTSISADVHKYGWCFKGASLVLYADADLLRRQYFLYEDWPGGLYGSATTAGTKPGGPLAAAWATVVHLGEEGYVRLAGDIARATDAFVGGIRAIPGLAITGSPDMSVFEFGSTTIDIGAVGDVMDDRGWHLDRQQGGLHCMLWPYHATVADQFLGDLGDAVGTGAASRGKEARYGGIA